MQKKTQKGFSVLWLVLGLGTLVTVSTVAYLGYSNLITKVVPPSTSDSVGTTYTPPLGEGGQVVPGSLYVAMGDSYSSGQGADRTPGSALDMSWYDPTTITVSNLCFRSRGNAATLLAKDKQYVMTDVSCSAAQGQYALTKGQWNEPPQINAINSDVSLVTLTFGGNDVALADVVLGCIMTTECKSTSRQAQTTAAATAKLPGMVNQILTAVTDKAKNVKIRWAGYPNPLAVPGKSVGVCTFLSANEQVLFNGLLNGVNNAIKQGIDTFNAQHTGTEFKFDVKYVDPLAADSPFMQTDNGLTRDGCSKNTNRAINGPLDVDAGEWHPNLNGHQYYYQLYKASL